MFKSFLVLLFFSAAALAAPSINLDKPFPSHDYNPEDNMTTTEIILNRGYPAETHLVTTDDGYIIEMHRIPYGKYSPPSPNKPAVFMFHCLLCSSADWIVSPTGLGYALADAGYDVWLGNVRGNTYGRRHVSLNPDTDSEFWDFSFDEFGGIDVPAQLKYILQFTQQDKLSYVGHSQGTMSFWIAMETNPDLNEKIDIMFALGPVAQMNHIKSPIKYLAPYAKYLKLVLELAGKKEFIPHSDFFQNLGEIACNDGDPTQILCIDVLFALGGFGRSNLNSTALPMFFSHTPAGTSLQNVMHFAQGINSGVFAHYDYGTLGNLKHYKQKTPPIYDLSKVKAPVVLMWGPEDWLADPTDVAWLATQLPNLVDNVRIAKDDFDHLDFIWGTHANELCYSIIIKKLSEVLQNN